MKVFENPIVDEEDQMDYDKEKKEWENCTKILSRIILTFICLDFLAAIFFIILYHEEL